MLFCYLICYHCSTTTTASAGGAALDPGPMATSLADSLYLLTYSSYWSQLLLDQFGLPKLISQLFDAMSSLRGSAAGLNAMAVMAHLTTAHLQSQQVEGICMTADVLTQLDQALMDILSPFAEVSLLQHCLQIVCILTTYQSVDSKLIAVA